MQIKKIKMMFPKKYQRIKQDTSNQLRRPLGLSSTAYQLLDTEDCLSPWRYAHYSSAARHSAASWLSLLSAAAPLDRPPDELRTLAPPRSRRHEY